MKRTINENIRNIFDLFLAKPTLDLIPKIDFVQILTPQCSSCNRPVIVYSLLIKLTYHFSITDIEDQCCTSHVVIFVAHSVPCSKFQEIFQKIEKEETVL